MSSASMTRTSRSTGDTLCARAAQLAGRTNAAAAISSTQKSVLRLRIIEKIALSIAIANAKL
jgi:hypothetical protein